MQNDPSADLRKRLSLALRAQRPKFDLFSEFDRIANVKGKPQKGVAQFHSADSWANIETVAPRLLAKRPNVTFRPRGTEDEDRSDAMAAVFEYWWNRDGAFQKGQDTVKAGLRYGTSFTRVYWKTERRLRKSYEYGEDGRPIVDPVTGKFYEREEEDVVFDDPCLETVSPYDIFVDPEALSLQSARWVVIRYRSSISDLKDYGFTNLSQVEDGMLDQSSHANDMRDAADLSPLTKDDTADRVTCFETWERTPKGWRTYTHGGLSVLIGKPRDNPYWHGRLPIQAFYDHRDPGSLWGKGEIEPVRYHQYAIDTLISQDLTNRTRLADFSKWKTYGDVDDDEVSDPDVAIIHLAVKGQDDVESIVPPDLTGTTQPGIEAMRASMNGGLGIFDYAKGGEISASATATGVTSQIEAANARFNLKTQNLEDWMAEVSYQVVSLYQQNMTEPRYMRMRGEGADYRSFVASPADIAGQFDVEVEKGSSTSANRELERQSALQVMQLMADVPDPDFQMELKTWVLDKFDGVGKVKKSLEEMVSRQKQQEQMMAIQEQSVAVAPQEDPYAGQIAEIDAQLAELDAVGA